MNRQVVKVAIGSVMVGIVVLTLKLAAWWVTGSVAMLSDALESIINVVASGLALFAIKVAARPADSGHPYGHTKAEYLSAVVEAVLIIIASVIIIREAYFGILDPRPADAPMQGLLLNGAASLINAVWCVVLIRVGRARRSPALVADGKHLFADVVTSIGVLAGFGLAAVTGWLLLDPLVAGVVALNIIWMGYTMMRDSLAGLMDAAAPPEVVERIREVVSRVGVGALEAHDLRTRSAGRTTFIDFHLVVPAAMTVQAAHDICDAIEAALHAEMPDLIIHIHVEPESERKLEGVPVL